MTASDLILESTVGNSLPPMAPARVKRQGAPPLDATIPFPTLCPARDPGKAIRCSRLGNLCMNAPDTIVVEPPRTATASVIWLHGLGADGHDFEPIVPELGADIVGHVRFIFPNAPMRPVTINGGYVMRAWYDIVDTDVTRRADESGVRESAVMLQGHVESEIAKGIPASRIVLAGFSQGGAIALHAGLRHPAPLAGVMALSTYLPVEHTVASEVHAANGAVPLFMAHGTEDTVIPLAQATRSKQLLETLGYTVEWRTYPMAHAVCPPEIEHIASWLRRLLA